MEKNGAINKMANSLDVQFKEAKSVVKKYEILIAWLTLESRTCGEIRRLEDKVKSLETKSGKSQELCISQTILAELEVIWENCRLNREKAQAEYDQNS